VTREHEFRWLLVAGAVLLLGSHFSARQGWREPRQARRATNRRTWDIRRTGVQDTC